MELIIIILSFFVLIFFFSMLSKNNNDRVYKKTDTIPEKYINFPVYNGEFLRKPEEVLTDKYDRLTLFYKGKPNEQFADSLFMLGYEQANNVRFEKDNTYVIFERIGKSTKIAYHIKKI